jgi:hypothetical protein
MKKYEIVLQNKKIKIYSTISWLIIVLNFIAFIYAGISGLTKNVWYPLAGAGILVIAFIFQALFQKNKNNKFDLLFGLIIITWLFMQLYWPAIINLVLYSLYSITARRFMVIVSEEGIIYPSFPKKTFEWIELNNMILKDDLLTIDFKNNKLIQQLTEGGIDPVDEKEFNDFCSRQIQRAGSAT